MTKEDYGDWDEVLANIPPNPLDEQIGNLAWDQLPADWESQNSPNGDAEKQAEPGFPIHHESFIPLPTGAPLPSADREWESRELAKKRQILLVATLGVVSSIVAGFAFWGFLRWIQAEKPIAQLPAVDPESKPNLAASENGKATDDGTVTGDGSVPEANPPTPPNGAAKDDRPVQEEKPGELIQPVGSGQNAEQPLAPKPANPLLDPGAGLTDFLRTPDPAKEGEANAPPQDKEPMSGSEPKSEPDLTDREKENTEKLPDIFGPGQFGALLGPSRGLTDGGFGRTAPLNELDIESLDEPMSILTYPDPQPVPVWGERASALSIARIKASDLPFVKCIELFGRMTGVGITLDWPSLRAAGQDESFQVSFDSQDTTLEKLFVSILAEKKLGIEMSPDGLPIVRPLKEVNGTKVETRWDLKGAVPEGTEKALGELLVSLWDIEGICKVDGGSLVWSETADPISKASAWSTLCLLARLQNQPIPAWSEPGTTPKLLFDPEDWKATLGVQSRTVESSVLVPELRSVSELLQIAADGTKTGLFIDWQAVWQHGLVPGQMEIAVLRNRTLPQVVKKFVDNHSLELVVMGRDRVMLTTPEARKMRFCVVPLKIPTGTELPDFKRLLYQLAPMGQDGRTRFRVSEIPGIEGIYLARITFPQVDQLDDTELETAFGW
ncbi:hypothetical protein SH467x_000310 [Pirellulaceae bacterium SH467]